MERYPAFRSQSHNVSKHVALMHELSRLIDVSPRHSFRHGVHTELANAPTYYIMQHCKLMDVSQLEQELACNDDHSSQHRELMEKVRGAEYKAADKLRLALLYALRYEDTADISSLKRELLDAGVSQQKVQLIDLILRHGGKVSFNFS